MSNKAQKQVGLMIETLRGYGTGILDGIARWVHNHPGWRIIVFDGERDELARLIRDWQGDGIICTISDDHMLAAAQSRDIPVVNVSGRITDASIVLRDQ